MANRSSSSVKCKYFSSFALHASSGASVEAQAAAKCRKFFFELSFFRSFWNVPKYQFERFSTILPRAWKFPSHDDKEAEARSWREIQSWSRLYMSTREMRLCAILSFVFLLKHQLSSVEMVASKARRKKMLKCCFGAPQAASRLFNNSFK